jgi:hypothetical protein
MQRPLPIYASTATRRRRGGWGRRRRRRWLGLGVPGLVSAGLLALVLAERALG